MSCISSCAVQYRSSRSRRAEPCSEGPSMAMSHTPKICRTSNRPCRWSFKTPFLLPVPSRLSAQGIPFSPASDHGTFGTLFCDTLHPSGHLVSARAGVSSRSSAAAPPHRFIASSLHGHNDNLKCPSAVAARGDGCPPSISSNLTSDRQLSPTRYFPNSAWLVVTVAWGSLHGERFYRLSYSHQHIEAGDRGLIAAN